MGPCPPIEKGKGRVVTMTVTHENSHIFELELSGLDTHGRAITETLCPTDVHKLYSVERSWVMTKNLRVGEVLRTQQGTATITSIKRKAGDYRVYNFEVEATHAYFVGATRTLSHNTDCPVTSTSGSTSSSGEWVVQDPHIQYGQKRAGPIFSRGEKVPKSIQGKSVAEASQLIATNKISTDVIEISVFNQGGQWVSANTRGFGGDLWGWPCANQYQGHPT